MRVAILSDVHSNLEALEAVIDDARNEDVTDFVFMGDIVGYGPNPVECISLAKSLNPSFFLMGNHDLFCTGVLMDMNPLALEAVKWTTAQLDSNTIDWLRSLPMTVSKKGCVFVHSILFRPQTFGYLMFEGRPLHFMEQIRLDKKVSFVGHSHRPEMCVCKDIEDDIRHLDPVLFESGNYIEIEDSLYTAINVGSVGQPRDHQWKATYVICEMDDWVPKTMKLRRVEYDVWKTARKVFDSPISNYQGERLIKHHPDYSSGL